MIIQLSPQVRDYNKIWYEIKDQKITVTINGISDTFDFTDMPNGKLQRYDSDGESMIESVLDEVPILGAEKKDGVLTVEILFSIDLTEQDERLLFPKPMTLDEFNDLMAELVERDKVVEHGPVDVVEEGSDDSLEETDDLVDPDEVVEDDRDETENINIEEVDF